LERNPILAAVEQLKSHSFIDSQLCRSLGYWHQRADEGLGNQEDLVINDDVGRLRGELGVSKSVECDTFSLQCSDTVDWATGRASGL